MGAQCKLFKFSVLLSALIFLLPFNVSAWWWNDDYQCNDIDGSLNIMTINLLFSEIKNRDERLDTIAQFVVDNDIHLILLQEVVGGLLVGTNNSAQDLQDLLEEYGLNYNLETAFETGLPGLLAVANSILSRCEIKFSIVRRLSRASEIEFDGRVIRLPRNVQMARLKIPGHYRISVYNTHWCAGCPPEELEDHWQESFEFLNAVESFLFGESRVIFGGDLNLDRFRSGIERDLYDETVDDIDGQGFSDAYADFVTDGLADLCNDPNIPDEHCTVDVTPLGGSGSRRIDYLLIRNIGDVVNAQVVFNTDVNPVAWPDPVSDHAGVVISVDLQ